MVDFSDLEVDLSSPEFTATKKTNEEIKAAAHMANGGDAVFSCPQCNGTGYVTIGYTYQRRAACFKCKATGKISKGQAAAIKGKATKEANKVQFAEDNREALIWLNKNAEWSEFYRSLLTQYQESGKLTENQLASVHKGIAKQAERKAQKEAASPVVNISAIEALFAKATNNAVKKPIFRTEHLIISQAPSNGRNAGALYIKGTESKDYLGKIVGGKFHAVYGAPKETHEQLLAVAADPSAEAIKYASKFSSCSCCGRTLKNPISVISVIGPICAENWGLEHLRDMAREEYARLKQEELDKI